MPIETLPDTDFQYYLIAFDADGNERTDDPDGQMSDRVTEVLAREPVTDVFLFCHGWLSDIPASRRQYRRWIRAVLDRREDLARFEEIQPGFYALAVGLHWPSMPWGDYDLEASPLSVGFDGARPHPPVAHLVDRYARRIADTPTARAALETIFNAAIDNIAPDTLPRAVREAYHVLDRESGLYGRGVGATPSGDRDPFDPERTFIAARREALSFGGFSWGGLLAPLRTLSFWKMKDRARQFGENGAFNLLANLQRVGGDQVRFHLMGHSFGCIVASAALTGDPADASPNRPVNSLLLAQGALSHWSYCPDIPLAPGTPGHFHGLIADRLVAGPIAITRSKWDTALGKWYPLAASAAGWVGRSMSFYSTANPPKYAALGTLGASGGPDFTPVDGNLLPATAHYPFEPGVIYNLDGDEFIREGGGPQGAHNDLARPEVAHLMWEAALASVNNN